MPYTPPSPRSPASSNSNLPSLSCNHSYDQPGRNGHRPTIPRSRSATYIHLHRRTPSILDKQPNQNGASTVTSANSVQKSSSAGHGVDATHFPTGEGMIMENGCSTSPAESRSSEEDEERGRGKQLRDLAETLRESIVLPKRTHSPNRMEIDNLPPEPEPTPAPELSVSPTSPALTPEAKKIVHSRSTSEVKFPVQPIDSMPSPGQLSPLEDSDDDCLELKQAPLLRKKSGELVKPALRGSAHRRPSSVPGTPTYSKAVHFNDNIEQVRHFLQVDRPSAVSAGSSPVEMYDSESDYPFGSDASPKSRAEWEIQTPNFPKDTPQRRLLPIRVERLSLSSDNKNLIGVVAVANIAYHKSVVARFTFDSWKTTSEVNAEYSHGHKEDPMKDRCDRFEFFIKLSDLTHLESKTLLLCTRYMVDGHEFWDNNSSDNFRVDFAKRLVAKPQNRTRSNAQSTPASRPPLPRSRTSQNLSRPRSYPSSSDEEFNATFGFGASSFPLQRPENGPVRMKKPDEPSDQHSRGNSLAGRYNFRSSLSAALSNAQNALGDRSGIQLKRANASKPRPTASNSASGQSSDRPRPDNFTSVRPELYSAEYNDLIQKFCYFVSSGKSQASGTSGAKAAPASSSPSGNQETPTQAETKKEDAPSAAPQMGGAGDEFDNSSNSSARSSASNSPPSPRPQPAALKPEGANDTPSSTRTSSPSFRPTSPLLLAYRSPSPSFGSAYEEFPHQGLSVQTTQC